MEPKEDEIDKSFADKESIDIDAELDSTMTEVKSGQSINLGYMICEFGQVLDIT